MSDCGHLSNEEAAKFCVELINNNTESILLAHLSKKIIFRTWLLLRQKMCWLIMI